MITLREAQILWDYEGREPDAPSVLVTQFAYENDAAYHCSWGACNAEFAEADDQGRLLQLFQKFHELVTFDGLEPRKLHEALCVIPEYQQALAERGLGGFIPADLLDA